MKFHDQKKILWCCLTINVTTLLILASVVISIYNDQRYITFGPNKHLYILSIKINNWFKWFTCILFIGGLNACEVLTNYFEFYILEFIKTQNIEFTNTHFYVNSLLVLNIIRKIFIIILSIVQFDFALGCVIISELAYAYTTKINLLKRETFMYESNNKAQKILFSEQIV